jgi:hypothetical protein
MDTAEPGPDRSGEPGSTNGEPASWTADVLDAIDLDEVLALGTDGTQRVDWAALVPDRSGLCPECGLPDGPRHETKCLAHPRPPSPWWIAFACFVLPLPLVVIVGPGALLLFAPLFALTWYILTR